MNIKNEIGQGQVIYKLAPIKFKSKSGSDRNIK